MSAGTAPSVRGADAAHGIAAGPRPRRARSAPASLGVACSAGRAPRAGAAPSDHSAIGSRIASPPGQLTPSALARPRRCPKELSITPTANFIVFSGTRASGARTAKPAAITTTDRGARGRGGQPDVVVLGAERDDDQRDLEPLEQDPFERDREGVEVPPAGRRRGPRAPPRSRARIRVPRRASPSARPSAAPPCAATAGRTASSSDADHDSERVDRQRGERRAEHRDDARRARARAAPTPASAERQLRVPTRPPARSSAPRRLDGAGEEDRQGKTQLGSAHQRESSAAAPRAGGDAIQPAPWRLARSSSKGSDGRDHRADRRDGAGGRGRARALAGGRADPRHGAPPVRPARARAGRRSSTDAETCSTASARWRASSRRPTWSSTSPS